MKASRRTFLKSCTLLGIGTAMGSCESTSKKQAARKISPSEDAYSWPKVWAYDGQSDLKITGIETFTRPNQTFTRVTADDGSFGWGQVANYHNDITAEVLHAMLARFFLDHDPYKPGGVTERAIEMNYKYPWSFVCRAAAGIETALWDLRGRKENKSVCEMIGGAPGLVPAYGSSMSRSIEPANEGNRLKKLKEERGFEAFKIRVGKVNGHDKDQWPGRTADIIPTVRRLVGEDTVLFADGNSCYTPPKAIEVGRLMEDHSYSMLEEPCPYWWLEWTADVAAELAVPVSGGEQDNDLAQWKRMIDMHAVDIVQPDICYIGGLSRTLAVAHLAAEAGMPCVPHSANLSMITVFAAHLMASIDNPAPFLEYSIEDTPWTDGLYLPALKIEDGRVKIPAGPGWGVQPSVAWLNRARYQKTEG